MISNPIAVCGPTSRRPLRVTLVTETYFPQVNGVSRTLDRLVSHLIGEGHALQVLTPRYRGCAKLPAGARRVDFPYFPFPLYPEVLVCLARPHRVREILREFAPDVVHVATEGPLGLTALSAARGLAIPVVSSFHTRFPQYLAFYSLGVLGPMAWRYLRWFHNRTAATLCPTPTLREELLLRGFENVDVWSRGVDAELFHPGRRDPEMRREWGIRPGDTVLTCVGRLASEKNLPLLLAAFRMLPRELRCRLILVGDGPLRPGLEASAEVADGRIVLTGYLRDEQLARAYASADLLVFPSLTETFGNVVLEAAACGLPAVTFDVPGPADMVRDGETGCLVREVGPEPLAEAVKAWVGAPQRRSAASRRARRWAEGQTWSAANAAVVSAYRGAVGNHSERGIPEPALAKRR